MKNNYKSFAIDLAYKAGALIKTNFYLGSKRTWKKDNTPVTETDFAVNKLVLDAVRKTYPDFGVLAEEESAMKDNAEYTWVCDPVDGTAPFSHGIPTFVFSLALTKNGESIMGVIYDPMCDRLLHAEKGRGAFLNGKRISVSKDTQIDTTKFIEAGGYSKLPDLQRALAAEGCRVMTFYSHVYAGMLVATGELVAAIYKGDKPWDAAAVKIIVEE